MHVDRIMKRDGISRERLCSGWEDKWSQDKILSKSDFEIVNDGNEY